MFFLILSLCVFVSTHNAPEENLISLRDYDFIGEDKRLSSLLAARMVMLQTHINQTGIHGDANVTDDHTTRQPVEVRPDFRPSPDQLHLNLRRYPAVNVSMDYAELFNASGEFSLDSNVSWIDPPSSAETLNLSQLAFLYGNITANVTGNLTASRRNPKFRDHSYWEYNMKVIDIMRQNIYMVQNRLIEIEPIIQQYQSDERFRIAYIYNRLDEWKKDIRTIYYAMQKVHEHRFIFKKHLFYYTHALRKNIDITYSIEFLIHLHSEYMKKMEQIMPRAQREDMYKTKKKKDDLEKSQKRP